MSRRSRPPRTRKSQGSDSQAPQVEGVASVAPPQEAVNDAGPRPPEAPVDELAALDAGWDELML
jgi:hypothetical protein